MGFLTKAARERDIDSDADATEEQYMRLFPKIGRDFVHKDDLEDALRELFATFISAGLSADTIVDDVQARRRAKEYKEFLEQDRLGSDVYPDLLKVTDGKKKRNK